MNKWLLVVLCSLLLGSANFLYQTINGEDWVLALERTYFQTVAIVIFAVLLGSWGE